MATADRTPPGADPAATGDPGRADRAAGAPATRAPARRRSRRARPRAEARRRARASPAGPRSWCWCVAVLTVSYASSMRAYLQQRAHIGDLKDADRGARGRHRRPRAREAALARPGVRRGPGPRAVRLRHARRDVVRRARRGRRPARGRRRRCPTRRRSLRADADRRGTTTPGTPSVLAGNPPTRTRRPPPTFIDEPGARRGPRRSRPVIDPADEAAIAAQLGREPRGIHEVGHRCPCGNPDVVTTEPRLPERHAVPDDLLPHLPARGLADRHARGLRA